MKLSKKAKASLDKVSLMFKNGNLPKKVAKTYIKGEGRPSDRWSLLNRCIMLAHGSEDCRGYKQWQKVNRQVKKGSKAIYILGPSIIKKEEEKEVEVKRLDGTVETETEVVEKQVLVGFHAIPVFRYEDTKGEPLPDYTPKELPPLADVLDKLGYEVGYEPHAGCNAARGAINPNKKNIRLMTEDVKTFWHELGHAVHDKISKNGLKGGQVGSQEVIAESVAAVLCHLYGYEGFLGHSRDYIKAYSDNGNAYKALTGYIRDIEKVLDYIFENGDN